MLFLLRHLNSRGQTGQQWSKCPLTRVFPRNLGRDKHTVTQTHPGEQTSNPHTLVNRPVCPGSFAVYYSSNQLLPCKQKPYYNILLSEVLLS